MANADVVDGDAEAVAPQFAHHGCRTRGIVEFVPLSHFYHDLPRGDPCGGDGAAERVDEAGAHDVLGHDVERELEILVSPQERLEIGQCPVEQLPSHRFDASAGFRQWNEVHRRDHRAVLTQPAGQYLAAPDVAGPQVED